ncbi:proteasome subunit [Dipodascopsis tothii]|uniref:proteasome subunit n=1 Tax=Dipodascopsis tothii TaxID=44089 RepID=UPI0034CD6E52
MQTAMSSRGAASFHSNLSTTMDILLGITTKDAVIVVTSRAAVRGISVLKANDDKTRVLTPRTLAAYTGEAGDTVQFTEYIQANVQLHSMRNGVDMSPQAVGSYVRNELATSLRSRNPYQVNLLIAGFDAATNTPLLYWVDYLAALASLPYAAHGYAAYYTVGLMDKLYRKDLTVAEGLEIMSKCVAELRTRLPVDFKGVQVKIVDKDGVREVDL